MSIKREYIEMYANNALTFYVKNNLVYHNFNHIQDMIDIAESYDCKLTLGQFLAILYHDSSYTPGAPDNEENSVKNMYQQINNMYQQINIENMNFYKRNEIDIAKQIILDTKTHIPTIEESELVIDLDLAILGFTRKIFSEYRNAIYDEYRKAYSNKSDDEFNILFFEGTISFGEEMLNRDNIYYTELFRNVYEKKATINLLKMVNDSKTKLKKYREKFKK